MAREESLEKMEQQANIQPDDRENGLITLAHIILQHHIKLHRKLHGNNQVPKDPIGGTDESPS